MLNEPRGGKVAMAVALNPERPDGLLSKLIVEDVAPTRADISSTFRDYAKAMQEIDAAEVKTRKEAIEILTKYEKVRTPRVFWV